MADQFQYVQLGEYDKYSVRIRPKRLNDSTVQPLPATLSIMDNASRIFTVSSTDQLMQITKDYEGQLTSSTVAIVINTYDGTSRLFSWIDHNIKWQEIILPSTSSADSHENIDVLNLLSTDAAGNLLFNGKKIEADLTMIHSHDNLDVLNQLSEDIDGNLLFDGKKIVADKELYTNPTPTTATVGGITAGSTFQDKTMQEMFDMLLYPYQAPSFMLFALSGYSTLEVGQPITAGSHTFTWTTSNPGNIKASSIDIADVSAGATLLSGINNTGSAAYMFPADIKSNTPGSHVFKIIGKNSNDVSFESSLTLNWRYKVFWGVSTLTALTSADIAGLSSALATSFAQTRSLDCSNQYMYFCIPVSFGVPTFVVNGLTSTAWVQDTVSFTNAYGVQSDYYVFRSTYLQSGSGISVVLK